MPFQTILFAANRDAQNEHKWKGEMKVIRVPKMSIDEKLLQVELTFQYLF